MSLTNTHLLNSVKNEYAYKLKSYIGVFSSIVVVQLISLLFSQSGSTSSGGGTGDIPVTVDYYSANVAIGFTIVATLINAIHITTKSFQEDGFLFIANRLSANLSNILFLITVSIFGGITAMLSGFLVRMITIILYSGNMLGSSLDISFTELAYGVGASIAFMLLASAVGYIAGSIVQISRIFIFVLPVVLFGVLALRGNSQGDQVGEVIFSFFFAESSFLLLLAKVIITSAALFACSMLITNNKEVRI